jgi:glycosyltransferase involved in cell wall biosynthesis
MEIYISTLGRYTEKEQNTLKYISEKWKPSTHVVVVEKEYKKYKQLLKDLDIIILPKNVKGLSANRQWLLENSHSDFICFLDDDLDFNKRKEGSIQLKKCKNIDGLFKIWINWLQNGYNLVGVSSRNGNNRILSDYEDCTRIMSAYAFNRNTLIKENIRFDRINIMQDFDVNLSLLEKGYPNRVSYKYAHSQSKGSGAKGGCSIYRTPELKRKGSFRLAYLHPKVVKVRSKITKTGWDNMESKAGIEGKVSVDVTIFWKKALKNKIENIQQKGIQDYIKE